MSDYLFDKQGQPDPEVARLERLMGTFAYRGKTPLPPRRRRPTVWLAAGALAATLAVLAWWRPWRPSATAWIETGDGERQLRVAQIGEVKLKAHTRARLVGEGGMSLVELAHGALEARIVAPPRRFAVATARARVIDLGCAFTVVSDDAGLGSVSVTEGHVAIGDGTRELEVAAGQSARLTADGPTPPFATDAIPPAPAPPAEKPTPAPPTEKPTEKPTPKPATHKPSTPHATKPTRAIESKPAQKPATTTTTTPTPTKPPQKQNDASKLVHDPWKNQTP